MSSRLSLNLDKEAIAEFCRRHHIRRLSIFGSALTDTFNAQSDIDVLVEFHDGFSPGFAFFDMESELSELLGRKVDLQTPGFLSRYFRQEVLDMAEVQFAEP